MKDSLESSSWMRRVMDTVSNGDQMMSADAKQIILNQLSAGLTVEEVCVLPLPHMCIIMCDKILSYLYYESFVRVPLHISMCATPSYVYHHVYVS